jgi:hypothetical protein
VSAKGDSRAGREVVQAFEAGDELAIRRFGWYSVWEACATWWAPRQSCTAHEFVPYAKLLGDEDPAAVLEAFRQLAGDWRPTPAQVRAYLYRSELASVDAGRGRDLAHTPEALRAVAAAHAAGERGCSCGVRRPAWRVDHAHVLRCVACGGLEYGQLFTAEDAGLIEAVA